MPRYNTTASPVPSPTRSVNETTMTYSAIVDGRSESMTQPCTYRALQRACKDAGISGKGATARLRRTLLVATVNARPRPLTDDEMFTALAMASDDRYECPDGPIFEAPVVKPATNKAPQAPKAKASSTKSTRRTTTMGQDYRTAQRFVSWYREEERETMPCKNIGWDNVEANIDYILNLPRFWKLLATNKRFAAAAAELGFTD